MAGLNLKKKDTRRDVKDDEISIIEQGASFSASSGEKSPKQAVFKRFSFSLTEEVSEDIEKMALRSRKKRLSRSDIVKAGVEALKELNDNDFDLIIKQVK